MFIQIINVNSFITFWYLHEEPLHVLTEHSPFPSEQIHGSLKKKKKASVNKQIVRKKKKKTADQDITVTLSITFTEVDLLARQMRHFQIGYCSVDGPNEE